MLSCMNFPVLTTESRPSSQHSICCFVSRFIHQRAMWVSWTYVSHPHPNGIWIGSAVFTHLIMPNTDTQTGTQTTLRATAVVIGRICAVHAADAA